MFSVLFDVTSQRLVKEHRLKLTLTNQGPILDSIQVNATAPVPPRVRFEVRLGIAKFKGRARNAMLVEAWEPA